MACKPPLVESATYVYTERDMGRDREIERMEQALVAAYARRARQHVVGPWWWCACGREKIIRAGAYEHHTRCGHAACPPCVPTCAVCHAGAGGPVTAVATGDVEAFCLDGLDDERTAYRAADAAEIARRTKQPIAAVAADLEPAVPRRKVWHGVRTGDWS